MSIDNTNMDLKCKTFILMDLENELNRFFGSKSMVIENVAHNDNGLTIIVYREVEVSSSTVTCGNWGRNTTPFDDGICDECYCKI